jgi:DNA-binding transcriptional MerR regulator
MSESPERGDSDNLLSPSKVRKLFGIGATTLQEWDAAGILRADQRTAGGHRRWRESKALALLAELSQAA